MSVKAALVVAFSAAFTAANVALAYTPKTQGVADGFMLKKPGHGMPDSHPIWRRLF
jgi:hypothetical protein